MRTVIETPTLQNQADKLWSEEERFNFIAWIAVNSEAGDVIPGAEGEHKQHDAFTNQKGGVKWILRK